MEYEDNVSADCVSGIIALIPLVITGKELEKGLKNIEELFEYQITYKRNRWPTYPGIRIMITCSNCPQPGQPC
jgi:hypothetical protein